MTLKTRIVRETVSGGSTTKTVTDGPLVLSPVQIVADQNDYNPGEGNYWRLSSDAARNITGILAGAGGQEMVIVNVGGFNIVLQHQNAGSAAANRMLCAGAADITLTPDAGARLIYDVTTGRWRVFTL